MFLTFLLEHGEQVIAIITSIIAAFITFKTITAIIDIINKVKTAVSGLFTLLSTFATANPIVLIIAAIVALVTEFIVLWNTSEEFRNFWIGLWNTISGAISTAWGVIKGIIDGIINAVESAINKIKEFFGLSNSGASRSGRLSEFGGGSGRNSSPRAFSLPTDNFEPVGIPQLANGGVLYKSTVAEIGEYPGAGNNPEIVTPQNIMRATMEEANANVVNAIYTIGNNITQSIEEKDTNVYLDNENMARKITEEQNIQRKQKGTSLVKK